MTPQDRALLANEPPDVPHGVRRLVVGGSVALTAAAVVGTALSPYLLVEHPLMLIALNPDIRHLVLVANRVEPWQAVAVGTLRRGLGFVSAFGLASLYGYLIIAWMEKHRPWMRRLIAGLESLYARVGVLLVLLVPVYSMAFFAGMARLSPRTFTLAIMPGQLAFVLASLWFGQTIEAWTAPVVALASRFVVEATLVATSLVAAQQVWSRHRKRNQGRATRW